MSERLRVEPDFLPPAVEALVDEACDQFEAACQKAGLSGPLPCIEDYVADVASAERGILVQELIPLDVHYRRRRSETPRPQDYQDRFPGIDPQWLAGAVEASQEPHGQAMGHWQTGPWKAAGSIPPDRDAIGPTQATGADEPLVPGYEILGELGRGGMGVVYKARQTSLNRLVALKMVLAGGYAGPEQITRFRAEAEAVARLQHPHIVQVYEIGQHAGRSFFSLEYCLGGSLAERFQGQPQPARMAAALVKTLAGAVQHAHEHGIIHRDLKPANVLLAEDDTLKVSDFGLAKQLDAQVAQTQTGSIVGTPSYMAPEQTAGQSKEVGPATDAYALGAILYEALTGRPPFRAASPLETLEQVRRQEPVSVRQVQPKVPKDLEIICQKCLQKDPVKRYASAAVLAEDLERFLAGKPIQARPVGQVERLGRWCRRNPMVASLTTAVFLLLAAVAGVASVGYVLTRLAFNSEAKQRTAAETAEENTRRQWYAAKLSLMQKVWDGSQVAPLRALLAETEAYPDRGFERYYWQRLCHLDQHTLIGHRAVVSAVSWSPDGNRLATASWDGTTKVWEATGGRELFTLKGHTTMVNTVSWSPDGKRLVTAGNDATAWVWDGVSGQELLPFKGHTRPVWSVSWSPDGKWLATGSDDGTAKVWETASGRELITLKGHRDWVQSVSWSPDGKRLATGSYDGTAKVWNAADSRELYTIKPHTARIQSVSWSPDGKRLATGILDGTAKVWDAANELQPRGGQHEQVGGRQFLWQEHRSPQAILDFNAVLGRTTAYSVAYAVCYLQSDRTRDDLWLHVGSDDEAKVYLNARTIYQCRAERALNVLERIGPVTLRQGTNVLVFKVVNEPDRWEGCVRLMDEAGRPAQGIRVSLIPQP
jgi:hypothetical protein